MQQIASDLEARATVQQLHQARKSVFKSATRHKMTNLRLAEDGTLVVTVEENPGYRSVISFIDDLSKVIGAPPHVITDDTERARRLETKPL